MSKTTTGPVNPAIVLLAIVFLSTVMTYLVDSGKYERLGSKVVPNTYNVVQKDSSFKQLFSLTPRDAKSTDASPVSLVETFVAIPQAIEKRSGLIFMVLFIGGMFSVLNRAGTIDAGIERLLGVTRGNIYVLVPTLVLVFAAGSTFMGLSKEYILFIPIVVAMVNRLGLPNIIGLAVVTLAVKAGYIASITNPFVLAIANPLVNLPVFSGIGMRVLTFFVFVPLCTAFILYHARGQHTQPQGGASIVGRPLGTRNVLILMALVSGIAFLVYASNRWGWSDSDQSAYYLAMTIIFATLAGMRPSQAASAFIDGMNKMLIAGVLIALATVVEMILDKGQILDTVVKGLSVLIGGENKYLSAIGMLFAQMSLDVLIPSTSGSAVVTMPIFSPLGQLSGVSPHTTVYAFLLGHSLMNMITPTSSGLLVLLAAAQVGWGQWARFVFPLFLISTLVCMALLSLAVFIGY